MSGAPAPPAIPAERRRPLLGGYSSSEGEEEDVEDRARRAGGRAGPGSGREPGPRFSYGRVVTNAVTLAFMALNLMGGYCVRLHALELRRPDAHVVEIEAPDAATAPGSEGGDAMQNSLLSQVETSDAVTESLEEDAAEELDGLVDKAVDQTIAEQAIAQKSAEAEGEGSGWMDEPAAPSTAAAAQASATSSAAKRKREELRRKAGAGRAAGAGSQAAPVQQQPPLKVAKKHLSKREELARRAKQKREATKAGRAAVQSRVTHKMKTDYLLHNKNSKGHNDLLTTVFLHQKQRRKFPCYAQAQARARPPPPPPAEAASSPLPPASKASWWGKAVGSLAGAAEEAGPTTTPPSPAPPSLEDAAAEAASPCEEGLAHVAMTLESNYMQGIVALLNSILSNAACPTLVYFHFITLQKEEAKCAQKLREFFPVGVLQFSTYTVDHFNVAHIVRKMSYRGGDLQNPLNYARIYLPSILPPCVKRTVYLDTDTIMVGRVEDLFNADLGEATIGSPEFCEFPFHRYFTDYFWHNRTISQPYQSKKNACYSNPGVMVVDLARWKRRHCTEQIEHWMRVQKFGKERIYRLGSLPPFLLVFAGKLKSLPWGWNTHDLGCGCNAKPDPTKAQLLHWSCDGKPWRRLAGKGKPCTTDKAYWKPYDLLGAPIKGISTIYPPGSRHRPPPPPPAAASTSASPVARAEPPAWEPPDRPPASPPNLLDVIAR